MKLTLLGIPRTKKNSQRFVTLKNGRHFLLQSKNYLEWEKDCLRQITGAQKARINYPINLKCFIFKNTKRKSDLVNYLNAVQDMLVKAEVLIDDNSDVVVSVDGSRLLYDKDDPRVEIEINGTNQNWGVENFSSLPCLIKG